MTLANSLDPQQSKAAAHRQGPAVVIAGPGAGKTRVLTARAASLLAEGIKPERILLLTFTRNAANTMISRARSADERAQFLTAGTFHSWGIKIINANAHIFGLKKPFTMLDQEDVVEMIKRSMEPLKGTSNWPRARTIAKIIGYCANTRISVAESLQKIAPDHIDLAEQVDAVRRSFIASKIDKGLMDYDDVLMFMSMLLRNEEIGQGIRNQYDYIMVDEYQDTNRVQLEVVHGLVGQNGNVMIVGDPGQSIYAFRGGAPATMSSFRNAFPSTTVIPLETNYRSTPEIVALVNAIDKQMEVGFERTLRAGKPSGSKPVIMDVTDSAAEASAIADAILEDKRNGGEISNHAVLVRSTAAARRIETEFISRKIPHKVRGGVRIDEAAHIKDLLCIGRLTTNLEHEPAWLRMLSRFPKIGPKAAETMTTRLVATSSLDEACAILRDEGNARKTPLKTLAEALEAAVSSPRIADSLDSAITVMQPIWSKVWEDDWKSRERDLEAVLLIAEEHPIMESFLTTITLDASMDRDRSSPEEKAEEDPVTISTIHSAKGLEWKHVHVPAFVQGGMPAMFAQGVEEEDEEKRIFYVVASRAEDTLTFYRPRFNGQGNFTSASSFEAIIRSFVDVKTHAGPTATSGGRVNTEARIDLRSQLLG